MTDTKDSFYEGFAVAEGEIDEDRERTYHDELDRMMTTIEETAQAVAVPWED